MTCHDMVSVGVVWEDMVWFGIARQGVVWCGVARMGASRHDVEHNGSNGTPWRAMVRRQCPWGFLVVSVSQPV